MAKNINDTFFSPAQETTQVQNPTDLFNAFLNAPVTRLDADEYKVGDLDGVGESLLGSGNLNFIMMQSAQTNAAMATSKGDFGAQDTGLFGALTFDPSRAALAEAARGAIFDNAMDRGLDINDLGNPDSSAVSSGGSQNAMTGGVSAANLAKNTNAVSPLSDISAFSASSESAQNGSNGADGANGANGANGGSGGNGGNTTIINNNTTNNNTTNNDYSVIGGDTNIEIINDNLFETINNIVNTKTDFLTEVVNNVTDIVNTKTDFLTEVVNNVTDIVDIKTDFLTEVVNNVTDIVNNIIDGTGGGGLGPVGLTLDATLDNLTELNLGIISGENIITVLDQTLNLSPVLEPVDDLLGDVLANVSFDAILNPFQYDSSPSDFDLKIGTDINLLGTQIPLPTLDVPLNPVEGLLGDIDVGLDAGEILAGLPLLGGAPDNNDTNLDIGGVTDVPILTPVTGIVDSVFNPVEDLAGDLDILGNLHVDLLHLGSDSPGPDTDLTIPLDLDLADNDLLDYIVTAPLDPVEHVLGDIDLDLGAAGDVLGDAADLLIDAAAGGTGTDNPLSSLGDIGEDIGGQVQGLIDPTGDGGLSLFDPADSQNAGDTDIHLDLAGSILPPLDIEIDFVESLVGDVDLSLDVDHMLDDAIGIIDCLPVHTGGLDLGVLLEAGVEAGGEASIPLWTENLLPDVGNILGDGLAGGIGDILHDPVAALPAAVAPIVPVVPVLPALGGGGLLGGGGGGLFG